MKQKKKVYFQEKQKLFSKYMINYRNHICLEKMKELIADQLGIDAETIAAESKFKEDLGADSLDLFELVMALEETFGVEIPDSEAEKISTVGDVVEYVKNIQK